MLALTYPDGARVQRCDYLPENRPIPGLIISRISVISDITEKSESGGDRRENENYASRYRRRSSRRGIKNRRKKSPHQKNVEDDFDSVVHQVPTTTAPLSSFTPSGIRPDHRTSCSSQSAAAISHDRIDHQRLPIFDVDDHTSEDGRRHELPGRESWPGGSHPKDRCCCFIQLVLILVLIMIGYNRHCGPLGSRANRSAFGVFAVGTSVLGRGHTAPVDVVNDAGVRAERSANLSHITGTSRKIQMFIKHRHLQILPDGTVNGSNDDTSDYTILQRASVSRGQLRIQGVATCLYLCMDSCGLLYGSREYTEDCVFNETLEQHNYFTYSSAHWSTPRKTLYLGLSGQGQPRRVQAKGHNLGRLSAYARVLTLVVAPDRVEALHRRMLGARHNVRHHHGSSQQSLCPVTAPQEKDGRDKFRCRKRKKRKKRRRKCKPGEVPGPQCEPRETGATPGPEAQSKRSCEGAAVEEACRREALDAPSKKRKSRVEDDELQQDEDLVVDSKTQRGVKKKGKNVGPSASGKIKAGGGKKKKIQNAAGKGTGEKNFGKLGKKRAGNNHPGGRFARTTTNRLGFYSTPVTSPISWFSSSTSPTILGDSTTPVSGIFSDRPKSLSSSSSTTVSAVSALAATSLASTLTLTVASAEVFHSEDDVNGARAIKNEGVFDPEEFTDVKELDDEDEEDRDEDEDEHDEARTDFANFTASTTDGEEKAEARRLAM